MIKTGKRLLKAAMRRLPIPRTEGISAFFFFSFIVTAFAAIADCGEGKPPDYTPFLIFGAAISFCSIAATFVTVKINNLDAKEKTPIWFWIVMFTIYLTAFAIIGILVVWAINILFPGEPSRCCLLIPYDSFFNACCRHGNLFSN